MFLEIIFDLQNFFKVLSLLFEIVLWIWAGSRKEVLENKFLKFSKRLNILKFSDLKYSKLNSWSFDNFVEFVVNFCQNEF